MAKSKEKDPPTRAERFMAERLQEAERRAREYEESLDPRQK